MDFIHHFCKGSGISVNSILILFKVSFDYFRREKIGIEWFDSSDFAIGIELMAQINKYYMKRKPKIVFI